VPREILSLAVRWLDALRSGDLAALEEILAPSVVWRGVVPDAICHDRDEVIALLREQIAEGLPDVYAVECVAGESSFAVGYRATDLTEVAGEPLPGQIWNVMTIRDGEIVEMKDFAQRNDALRAAEAGDPAWV
jgi:ketosteroid isomerase-like protein